MLKYGFFWPITKPTQKGWPNFIFFPSLFCNLWLSGKFIEWLFWIRLNFQINFWNKCKKPRVIESRIDLWNWWVDWKHSYPWWLDPYPCMLILIAVVSEVRDFPLHHSLWFVKVWYFFVIDIIFPLTCCSSINSCCRVLNCLVENIAINLYTLFRHHLHCLNTFFRFMVDLRH